MKKVLLGLGTNLGSFDEKIKNLGIACEKIAKNKKIYILKKSSIYLTEPIDMNSSNLFLNAVIMIETSLPPLDLLKFLQNIEKNMGRIEKFNKSQILNSNIYIDRIIDIDILDFEDNIFNDEFLNIPHKKMHEREFVLYPINEIFSEWKHPVLKKTAKTFISEILVSHKVHKTDIAF
jgi:2-amino-4-hydroxy-6-hydroxymethyldihydropteridine diphosphokinase